MSKATEIMRELMDVVDDADGLPIIDILALVGEGGDYQRLDESGQWIDGRFEKNIRIDSAAHLGKGDRHAHVLGRKGNELVVVNADGTASHGTKGKIHKKDASALRDKGFTIPPNGIIEWWPAADLGELQMLFG